MTNNNMAIKFGIGAGLFYCLIGTACYMAGIDTYVRFLFWYTWVPVVFIIIFLGAFRLRRQAGGFISFNEVLKFSFLAYVLYELLYAIYFYVLYSVIDPNLTANVITEVMEQTRNMLEGFGAQDDQVEETLETVRQQRTGQGGFKQISIGFGLALIYNFVKSVIISAIVKKEKPLFD